MKTAGWAGLFIASFLVGHFFANPWLYPVGKILLFIEIYLSALVVFIILDQIIPYIWRILSKWQVDFQQSTGMKEQSLSGGMRLSFAAAGLSSALEKGKEETSSHPEPMPRKLSASGDGAASAAVTFLTATVAGAAASKKEGYWKEADPPRKLVLSPSIKAEPEKNPDPIIAADNAEGPDESTATCEAVIEDIACKEDTVAVEEVTVANIIEDNAECPDESIATCEAVTEEKALKEDTVAVEEVTAASSIEDIVETELIETCEIVPATVEVVLEDTQESSAEQVEGIEQSFIAGVENTLEAETETAEIIAPMEVPEELKGEELELEELEPLGVESDVSVESVPPARVIPVAFRWPENENLERLLAMDATGIAAETMDKAEEILLDTIDFEAMDEDFAVEGTDLSSFGETILRGGVADGSIDQVAVANEENAEIIEVAETVEAGANIMATEESIGSNRTEQDLRDTGPMAQQYQDLELSLEPSGENLAMDNSIESEFECVFVEETGESSGFDICETVELAQIEPIMPISIEVDSFEPTGCVDTQLIEAATSEETPETVIVDDIIELRPVEAEISIHNTQKVEERFIPMPHSYSCRLRCQKPGGIFQGPVLSFYCRFICQHGNY